MKYFTLITMLFLGLTINAQTCQFPVNQKGNFKTYISKENIEFTVGQKIEIDLPYSGNIYNFITQGSQPAGTVITGAVVEITKLKAIGNKSIGYKMFAQFKGFGALPVDIDIENALKVGEIVIPSE